MNLHHKSVDYAFLITIAGIGGLLSLAGLLFGLALGAVTMGYFLAAGCLALTVGVIGWFLYIGRTSPPVLAEALLVARVEPPQAITSLEGELVSCNMPYRLFLKESLNRGVVSPMDLMADEPARLLKKSLLDLDKDNRYARVIELHTGDLEKKYAEVTLSRKSDQEDFVSWTFSGSISALPVENIGRQEQGFNLEQLGEFLDCGDCGLIAVSEEGQVIYANNMLLHWMTGRSVKDVHLPLPLANFCTTAAKQLNGQIQVRTLSGEEILLEFLPIEAILGDQKGGGMLESGSENDGLRICQVFSSQSATHANEGDTENINFDRFFRESPIGIAIVSEQGEVLERNHIFREYVQDLEIKNTRSLKHIIDPEEYQEFYDQIGTTLKTGQASSIADLGFKGKGEKHGQIYITRLNKFNDHDKVAILYLIDTTEQKNLELQFAQSQKMQAVWPSWQVGLLMTLITC